MSQTMPSWVLEFEVIGPGKVLEFDPDYRIPHYLKTLSLAYLPGVLTPHTQHLRHKQICENSPHFWASLLPTHPYLSS